MFVDSLFILNNSYLHRRKQLLNRLLQKGFQIQGSRKINFTPELAAEFFVDKAEDADFMLKVIMLSGGPSEAFIVAKPNAVEDLLSFMVCFFGSSVEMDRYVYVTRCAEKVKNDISFIFPNYISEPVTCPKPYNICCNKPFVTSLLHKVYDIVSKPEIDPHKSLNIKLAEWCTDSNRNLPNVSNRCSYRPGFEFHEVAQQTKITSFKHEPVLQPTRMPCFMTMRPKDSSSEITSLIDTTSSCLTCSEFGTSDECIVQYQKTMDAIVKGKTAQLSLLESLSSIDLCKKIHEDRENAADDVESKGSKRKIDKNHNTGAGDAPPMGLVLDSSLHSHPSKGKVASLPSLPFKEKTASIDKTPSKRTVTSVKSVQRIPSLEVTASAKSVKQSLSTAKRLSSGYVSKLKSIEKINPDVSVPQHSSQSITALAVNVSQNSSTDEMLSSANISAVPSTNISSAENLPQDVVNDSPDETQGSAHTSEQDAWSQETE